MTEMMEFFKAAGASGGKKRAAKMTKAERSASASEAAKARWAKVRSAKAKAKRKEGK